MKIFEIAAIVYTSLAMILPATIFVYTVRVMLDKLTRRLGINDQRDPDISSDTDSAMPTHEHEHSYPASDVDVYANEQTAGDEWEGSVESIKREIDVLLDRVRSVGGSGVVVVAIHDPLSDVDETIISRRGCEYTAIGIMAKATHYLLNEGVTVADDDE